MRRLNLELPDAVGERLDRLKTKFEVGTLTAAIKRSLLLAETLLDHEGKVLLEAEDGSIRQIQIR